jgi:hypothetical protein
MVAAGNGGYCRAPGRREYPPHRSEQSMVHVANAAGPWTQLQSAFLSQCGDRGPLEFEEGTLVVLPSLTLPYDELKDVLGIQYYEERLLFILLLLRRPRLRIVYLSSSPIDQEIREYYLGHLERPAEARGRLTLISADDRRQQSLTSKILSNNAMVERVRAALPTSGPCFLLPFNVTPQEEELASRIGVPMYGPPAAAAHLGDKSNGRRLARAAGVPVVEGFEDLHSLADVAASFARLGSTVRRGRAYLKLNDSFSGMGNVILCGSHRDGARRIGSGPLWAVLPDGVVTFQDYLGRLERRGGVLEREVPRPVSAPSVQVLVRPGRAPEVVSTHDQILGGVEDQVYLGCSFPADSRYRELISELAIKLAEQLALRSVVGSFAIDFLTSSSAGPDTVYFGELNLRLGGTTHPFGICKYLTDSEYDRSTGMLRSPQGLRSYVASDNVQNDELIGQPPASVLKMLAARRLLFDRREMQGITLHQMGSIPESGKFGMCSIARSTTEAMDRFSAAVEVVSS